MKNSLKKIANLTKILVGSICVIILMITIFAAINNKTSKVENYGLIPLANISELAIAESNADFIYLSNLDYIPSKSSTAWGEIKKDETTDGNKITVRVEGGVYSFDKGMWAHAKSTLVYDLRELNFDYFTSYVGLNTTGNKGNGVTFSIYTSIDGENWDLAIDSIPVLPNTNSVFVKVNIKDANYLKLYADDNGNNGQDHAVYADAKLITENYSDEQNIVESLNELDEIIKSQYADASLDNTDFEFVLLKRAFVNNVGGFALKTFVNERESNKEVLEWLLNKDNIDVLRYYILGGTPEGGNYYNSLTQLSRLYYNYKDDFFNTETLNNKWDANLTYGDLYKKMAVSLSLTHSQRVGLWMQNSAENQSDSVKRYAIYKYLHKNGKLNAMENWDITPWFESLKVEEMRFVMNNAIDDEEILWLNDYVQSFLDKYKQSKYLTPHPYMAYVWPNYSNNIYYDDENRDYFNELFSVPDKNNPGGKIGLFDLSYTIPGGKESPEYTIKITRGTMDYKLYKLWMNFRNKFGTGAVCGGISKSGSNIRATYGIPATVIGQPGHAALLYYTKDANGKGYWNIDNDVSGWTLSEKGERLLLGWGNGSYVRGFYQVVYMTLAQEALNDYVNLEKSEKLVMLTDVYKGNLPKQEEIYKEALNVQSINFDAWYGLIQTYLADETKTEADFYNLAEEVAEGLKYFPLPMYNLTNLIKPKITSIETSYRFTLLQSRILTEASQTPNNTADNYYVYQPSITRIEASYLLGKMDRTVATFSFDGEDAGKIVLSDRYDSTGIRWDYSLDGKKTWNEVSFTAEEEHKLTLTEDQLNSITDENDIYVHIVGVDYSENNLYKIDILTPTTLTGIYNNDKENKVIGVTSYMEWRMEGNEEWTLFSDKEPDLTGDKTVIVRAGKHGVYLTSNEITLKYTKDIVDKKRKYVTIDRLSIESVSSEATGNQGHAKNAIDGNINTRWHSAWNGTDTDKFIIIKVDEPINLSAIEYLPASGGNGKILSAQILVSMDGENWTEIAESVKWANDDTLKSAEFDDSVRAQYIKIVGLKTSSASSLSFMAARMFNIYEDITKIPTAEIKYDITDPTTGNVTVSLINPSEPITIINNDGKDTYVFEKNGDFTFEFVNKNNIKGTVTAIVKNIDRQKPTATIKYSTTSKTTDKVTATLVNESEPITITNNKGNKTYTFTENGTFEFIYKDAAGNIGKTIAKVDWIYKQNSIPDIEKNNNVSSNGTTNSLNESISNQDNSKMNIDHDTKIDNSEKTISDNTNGQIDDSKNEKDMEKESIQEKSIWSTILYYSVPFVIIIAISVIITILQEGYIYKKS